MTDIFQIGIKHLTFNKKLKDARMKKGLSQKEVADFVGISASTYGLFEQIKQFPKGDLALNIADFLEVNVNDIFPKWSETIHTARGLRHTIIDIEKKRFNAPEILRLASGFDTVEEVSKDMLHEDIYKVLETLRPREKNILIKRFGLDGQEPMRLDQLALMFKITRERVRQIELAAIRRMRHPSRVKYISNYL